MWRGPSPLLAQKSVHISSPKNFLLRSLYATPLKTTSFSFGKYIQEEVPYARFGAQWRGFAVKTILVPHMADSISEGQIQKWHKKVGDSVKIDELVCQIETDKIVVDIRAPEAGVITQILAGEGTTVLVDADLYKLDSDGKAATAAPPTDPTPKSTPTPQPQTPSAPSAKEKEAPPKESPKPAKETQAVKEVPAPALPVASGKGRERTEHRVVMSKIRLRIAERLKASQNTYALLTTFQEADMSNLMSMREQLKDEFSEKHDGVKLGFMSAFVKASVIALKESPVVNAVIDEKDKTIVYKDYMDIGVAVATPTGLMVPIIRDCDLLSFADIEKTIAHYGKKARDGKIVLEDMAGGTFTISNGGVYGSMMGTPIVNPPQSAILGMHAITKRAVVVNDQIVIRPMMYLALTYDHRLIDGKDAVTFLKRIKELVEDPRRMLLS